MTAQPTAHEAIGPANVEAFEVLSSDQPPEVKIRKLTKLAEELEAEAEAKMLHAGSIRQVAEGLQALSPGTQNNREEQSNLTESSPPASTPATEDRLNTREGIGVLMRAGGVWSINTLVGELLERGWGPVEAESPARAVEAALSRMNKAGEVDRFARGKYRYKQNFPGSVAVEPMSRAVHDSQLGFGGERNQ